MVSSHIFGVEHARRTTGFFTGHLRECREDSDLDLHLDLRARGLIKKRLDLNTELYTILQIFNLTLLERSPLKLLLTNEIRITESSDDIQLNLFDISTGQ